MKTKLNKLIQKYPGYVREILDLDSNSINLIYNMEQNDALKLLENISNNEYKNKKQNEEKIQVLYYSNL